MQCVLLVANQHATNIAALGSMFQSKLRAVEVNDLPLAVSFFNRVDERKGSRRGLDCDSTENQLLVGLLPFDLIQSKNGIFELAFKEHSPDHLHMSLLAASVVPITFEVL